MRDAFLKLNRARLHQSTLEAEIELFQQRGPCRWSYVASDNQLDRSTVTIEVIAEVREKTPAGWGLIVGDILTNLRASLDHAVFAVAAGRAQLSNTDERALMFPIATDEAHWIRSSAKIAPHLARAVMNVVSESQPFRTTEPGTNPLALLNSLVSRDKHRAIQIVTSVSTGMKVVSAEGIEILRTLVEPGPLLTGMVGAQVIVRKPHSPRGIESLKNRHFETRHATDECIELPGTGELRPVLGVMDSFFSVVERILQTLESVSNQKESPC